VKLGLIARADNSGLAVQTWEFSRHLNPVKTLVIDVGHLHNTTDHSNKRTFLDRYPHAMIHRGWEPDAATIHQFVKGLDVVFTCETPYSRPLIPIAHQHGARVVIAPNYEFLDKTLQPDLWAAPTMWHWDDIPEPKIHLPVPIALDRVPRTPHPNAENPRGATEVNNAHFLHIVGRPAVHDRNGTAQLIEALRNVEAEITLTLRCQHATYLNEIDTRRVPPNVILNLESRDVDNYWELYSRGDVLIMPRRFGGLCLPALEALGAGMPVIMPDIEPNNTWLPAEWLVPAHHAERFHAMQPVDVYTVDHEALAAKITQFTDSDFRRLAKKQAIAIAHENSWEALTPRYKEVLGALVSERCAS